MASLSPVIERTTMMHDQHGSIRVAHMDGYRYLAQPDLYRVLEYHTQRAAYAVWSEYQRIKGGFEFLAQVQKDLNAGRSLDQRIPTQFTDPQGVVWVLSSIAIHAVAEYYPELQYRIIKHFDEACAQDVPPASSLPQAGLPMTLEDAMQLNQQVGAMNQQMGVALQTLAQHRAVIHEHTTQLATHAYAIQRLEAERQGPRTVSLMGYYHLYYKKFKRHVHRRYAPTIEDLNKEAKAFVQWVRHTDPTWQGAEKIPDQRFGEVNAYDIDLLNRFYQLGPEECL